MDLRTKKTLRAIKNSFIEIRKKKDLNKITIKELAQHAEISKATFYLHYHDIYELSELLQQEIIAQIFDEIEHPQWLITNPEKFTLEFVSALLLNKEQIDILFSNQQSLAIAQSIETEIRNQVFTEMPHLKSNPLINTYITYQIQGSYLAYITNQKLFSKEQILPAINHVATLFSESIYASYLKKDD